MSKPDEKAFPLPLELRPFAPARLASLGEKRQLYTVKARFVFVSPVFGEIEVPEGFVTDFASVPRAVWSYLSPEDPVIIFASVVHDWLYSVRGDLGAGAVMQRAQCDAVLREAMLASGARASMAWLVEKTVGIFGGSRWDGEKEESA